MYYQHGHVAGRSCSAALTDKVAQLQCFFLQKKNPVNLPEYSYGYGAILASTDVEDHRSNPRSIGVESCAEHRSCNLASLDALLKSMGDQGEKLTISKQAANI